MKQIISAVFVGVLALAYPDNGVAQGVSGVEPYNNLPIETVRIRIANPSADAGLNDRVEDQVRSRLGLFPSAKFSQQRIEFQLAQARRIRDVGDVDYDIDFGRQGGLDLTITVTLSDGGEEGRGLAFGGDFPVIYEKDGTFVRFKLDALALYYGNGGAWYGQSDDMLAGNPLADNPSTGDGWEDWIEAYLHYGVYGMTPINDQLYVYGGLSAITSFSSGQELFTDKTRDFTAIEDAYVGLVGGSTDEAGNRLAYNLNIGRQRFTLANGFLIANTSSNGDERAALQANARWSADLLAHARLRYNTTMVEAFYLDPDELDLLDTGTTYAGVNVEFQPIEHFNVGVSYVTSPESDFNYFGPTGGVVGTREGLQVWDARFTYTPNGAGAGGWFFGGEYARQTNQNFDMDARAGWAEVGYSFPTARWSPTISYRYSHFTGDDASTSTYERWDPMLSGGSGEQWVQGANHFKVVQDSNVIAHRIQARLRPSPKVELVPQLWAFYADSETNVGGNPALTFLDGKEYGFEANITGKWFVSRNTYVHGHIAYTWPGSATKRALAPSGGADDWWSAMLFVRYAF